MTKKEINGVEINSRNIIISLKIIQSVCEDNISDCTRCPFSTESLNDNSCICNVLQTPNKWKITDYMKFQALELNGMR